MLSFPDIRVNIEVNTGTYVGSDIEVDVAVYTSFMADENSDQRIIHEMYKYLNKGRFGSDFVDQVPLILANLYNITIGILTRIQDSDTYSVRWIQPRGVSSRYVCIIKRDNHYMAVSLDKCKILYPIH